MSSLANWSYTNRATVWPLIGVDRLNGGAKVYGEPYVIACGYIGKGMAGPTSKDAEGKEFVVENTFFCEDPRPKYQDRIAKGTRTGLWSDNAAEEIKQIIDYEMTAFGANELTDFEILT